MQKISLQKRSFFNSIGLDTNNLPPELQIKSNSIQTKVPKEDLKFLNQKDLTIPKEKYFRLKNLFGTDNIKLDNKTWIEIFSENLKTDEIIKLYFNNPNYYYKDLKKLNQIDLKHNNAIELYEDNGKFFIKDGLARISLMMIKYLLEMSRAQSKEEKLMINKQYTFAAVVRSTPVDRDIMYLINMLFDIYGSKLKLKKIDNDNECSYIMIFDNKKIEIISKNDFETFLKNSYLPREFKSYDRLKLRLNNVVKIGLEYKENEENEDLVDQFLVMGKIFPNYEAFVKYYKKLVGYGIEDDFIKKLDLENVTYDDTLKKLIKIVKQEEISMSKLEIKDNVNSIAKNKTTKKTTPKKESTKSNKAKDNIVEETTTNKVVKIKVAQKVPDNNLEDMAEVKAKEEELNKKINKVKESASSSISSILDNIEMTYYRLKTEESKSLDLANSTGVELNIDKINDNSISSNINSIKENSVVIRKKIEKSNELDELSYNNEFLNDLKRISSDKSIINEFGEEMKSIYMTCFNKNVRKMITDSKLKKLDKQRKEIEGEKCSFFSKLIGKAKLKQARLDNINLKEQLILTESQFSSSSYTTIEDGLSDIYAYIRTEEDASCLSDVKVYLRNVEQNNQIRDMIDTNRLSQKTREKIDQQRNLPQLVLSKEKKKLFSKAQINMVQEKNNELKRVIQINRANSLKMQNTGLIPILGNIKSTKAVKKFISNLSQIDSSLKTQSE